MGPDRTGGLGHVARPECVDGVGPVALKLAGIDRRHRPRVEDQVGVKRSHDVLHRVSVVDRHGVDVGRHHLMENARHRTVGREEVDPSSADWHPSGQRVDQVAPELPVGTGDEDSHDNDRLQPGEPQASSMTMARANSGSHHDRCCAYHATVSARPSSQVIEGAQSNCERSLAESSR